MMISLDIIHLTFTYKVFLIFFSLVYQAASEKKSVIKGQNLIRSGT